MISIITKIRFLFPWVISIFIFAFWAMPVASDPLVEENATVSSPYMITHTTAFTSFLPIIAHPPSEDEVDEPATIKVVSSASYTDTFDALYIVGEVINDTSGNVTSIEITATLFDPEGQELDIDSSFALIDTLAPGQKAPFKIYFPEYLPETSSYRLTVIALKTTQAANPQLSILNSDHWETKTGNLYTVGEVQNNTSDTIEFIKAIITYYDSYGRVTNVEFGYVEIDILGPNQKGPFKIYGRHRLYDSYTLAVDYDSTEENLPTGAEIINTDLWTEAGFTRITGEIQNNTEENIQAIKIVATYYDDEGKIADVLSTYVEVDILTSGQKGCFKTFVTDRAYSSYQLITDFVVTQTPPPDLEVLNVTPSGDLKLTGAVRNNHTTQTYDFVQAVATLYDGTGKVLNCEDSYTSPSEVGPGIEVPYEVDFSLHTVGWTDYTVMATN